MLTISDPGRPDVISRRTLLRVGGLGAVGLSLPQLLQAESKAKSRRERSCIVIFANGGPSQLDTFDPKPDAPSQFRSDFKPTATTVPGIQISELLPRLAQMASRYALVRTVTHKLTAHTTAAYLALTGHAPPRLTAVLPADSADFPAVGSVLSQLQPTNASLPSYVVAPQLSYDVNSITPGQLAGFLGGAHAPFVAKGDLSRRDFKVQHLNPTKDLPAQRLERRRELLRQFQTEPGVGQHTAQPNRDWDAHFERAYNLLTSSAANQAFDLSKEKDTLRDQYGRNQFGQSYLLARRLIEAGVRMVLINDTTGSTTNRWDNHNGTTKPLSVNLPQTDAALSSLLEDLSQRGLLENTLVLWMGEMGRDPKMPHGGHWPQCYTVLMAGGGIRGGQVYGCSDRIAAYPKENPVTPGDILATLYHQMGLAEQTVLHGRDNREIPLFAGKPIKVLI